MPRPRAVPRRGGFSCAAAAVAQAQRSAGGSWGRGAFPGCGLAGAGTRRATSRHATRRTFAVRDTSRRRGHASHRPPDSIDGCQELTSGPPRLIQPPNSEWFRSVPRTSKPACPKLSIGERQSGSKPDGERSWRTSNCQVPGHWQCRASVTRKTSRLAWECLVRRLRMRRTAPQSYRSAPLLGSPHQVDGLQTSAPASWGGKRTDFFRWAARAANAAGWSCA